MICDDIISIGLTVRAVVYFIAQILTRDSCLDCSISAGKGHNN